jgi:uncharacterized membrane protein
LPSSNSIFIQDYENAREMLLEFEKSSEKGKNWTQYMELLNYLIEDPTKKKKIELDTFEQNHRISKNWPKITLPEL